MTLPKVHTDHETVDVGGALFDVRAITRGEAARFHKLEENGSKKELELAVISAATDTPLEETKEWYETSPSWAAEELIAHIYRISRVGEEAQKSGGTSDSPGGG